MEDCCNADNSMAVGIEASRMHKLGIIRPETKKSG